MRGTFSPLAQAAIVHAQFETIHPFIIPKVYLWGDGQRELLEGVQDRPPFITVRET